MPDPTKPRPGSDAALDAGCTCPVLDNARGKGCGHRDPQTGEPLFWISETCPIHAGKEEVKQ